MSEPDDEEDFDDGEEEHYCKWHSDEDDCPRCGECVECGMCECGIDDSCDDFEDDDDE